MWTWTKKNIATVISLVTLTGVIAGGVMTYATLPKAVDNHSTRITSIEQTTNIIGNDISFLKVKTTDYGIRLERIEKDSVDIKMELKTYQSEINATLKAISKSMDKMLDIHTK